MSAAAQQPGASAKGAIVSCEIDDGVALIRMDDGKGNVISPRMLDQLHRALDQAEQANAAVVLTGREEIFSAGFDLNIMKSDVLGALRMLLGGFRLSHRLLSFPTPVVIACNGHAVAMGAFLLLSGDYRLGTNAEYKIVANEVAIGLTMPHSAIVICRQRLAPAHFNRAVLLSEHYEPSSAVDAGFLDRIVAKDELLAEAKGLAQGYTSLDPKAHKQSKLRMRGPLLKALAKAIRADRRAFIGMGIARLLGRG